MQVEYLVFLIDHIVIDQLQYHLTKLGEDRWRLVKYLEGKAQDKLIFIREKITGG